MALTRRRLLAGAAACCVLALTDPAGVTLQTARRLPPPAGLDRTSFQTNASYSPLLDLRTDTVMVYANALGSGLGTRLASWRGHGYRLAVMASISHDWTGQFVTGGFDGVPHRGQVQQDESGTLMTIGNGFYMVPTAQWRDYLVAIGDRAGRLGATAFYLEEPEFWLHAGYSPAFQDAWKLVYGAAWEDPLSSESAWYRAGELKALLYTELAREVAARLRSSHPGMAVGIAAHSNLNYLQWGIVCPHYGLYQLAATDHYIGQIWSSTVRSPVPFLGQAPSLPTFNGWLEYSTVAALPATPAKTRFFLADPKSDRSGQSWTHYRHGYQDAVIPGLAFPSIDRYEVVPWPERVFGEDVPAQYGQELLATFRALEAMGAPGPGGGPDPLQGLGAFTSDTVMWQGQADRLYGMVLPLLTQGITAPLLTLEAAGTPGYLDPYRVLLLSYDPLKPLNAGIHASLARWVRAGGRLLFVRGHTDFDAVPAWWRTAGDAAPQNDLLRRLGLAATAAASLTLWGGEAPEGAAGTAARLQVPGGLGPPGGDAALYRVPGSRPLLTLGGQTAAWEIGVGRGRLLYCALPSEYFGATPAGAALLRALVGFLAEGTAVATGGEDLLVTRRHGYVSVVGVGGGSVPGTFADLRGAGFPVVRDPQVPAGGTALLRELPVGTVPAVVCTTLRLEEVESSPRETVLLGSGPTGVPGLTRLAARGLRPAAVAFGDSPLPWSWDAGTGTCLIQHPMTVWPTPLRVEWTPA